MEDLRDHIIQTHLIPEGTYDEFKCPLGFCRFLANSEQNLRTHILENHIEENIKKENEQNSENFIHDRTPQSQDDHKVESDQESDTHSDLESDLENENDPDELLTYQQASKEHTRHMRTLVFGRNGKEKKIKSCDLCSYTNESRRSFRKRV